MNHFKCPYDPFACDHSLFCEWPADSSGKVRRWVECADYYCYWDMRKWKIVWVMSEAFTLIVNGVEVEVKKGDLCVNNPSDWWDEYKKHHP